MKAVTLKRRFDAQRHLSKRAPGHRAWLAALLEPIGFERNTVAPLLQRAWHCTDRSSFEGSR